MQNTRSAITQSEERNASRVDQERYQIK